MASEQIGRIASENVTLLRGGMKPSEAFSRLGPNRFGLVLDDHGVVAGLVGAEDLKWAADHRVPRLVHPDTLLPPTIVADAESRIAQVAGTWAEEIAPAAGGRGVLVVDEDMEAKGVVDAEVLRSYLGGDEALSAERISYLGKGPGYLDELYARFSLPTAVAGTTSLGTGGIATLGFLSGVLGTVGGTGNAADSQLGGKIKEVGFIIVRCRECQFSNAWKWLKRTRPPFCQNPRPPKHRLKLA